MAGLSAESIAADLELALRLAAEARSISLTLFRGEFGRRTKADGSIVTDADEAVERAIRERVARERPGDAMLGEEFGETGRSARRWIVDAIDGTSSFAAGRREWGTLIALEIDGELIVGVCDMAPIDRCYYAGRGLGAFRRATGGTADQLAVTATTALAGARCHLPSARWTPPADQARSEAFAAVATAVAVDDHPALLVAAGALDVAVSFMGGPWDVAAPAAIVIEAGGRFADFTGGTNIGLGGGLFSNGRIHEAAIGILGR